MEGVQTLGETALLQPCTLQGKFPGVLRWSHPSGPPFSAPTETPRRILSSPFGLLQRGCSEAFRLNSWC